MPKMTEFFMTNKSLIQLSISFYMLGLGLLQILAGPISDSFGRKKPFIIGMMLYLLSTGLIISCHNIYVLLALRALQGISVAILVVPIRSVIPDLFSGKELQKYMSYVVTAWAIGPIIAPVIGGYLQHQFDWQANFIWLFAYGSIAFILVVFFLPETSEQRHAFKFNVIINNTHDILSNTSFLRALFSNGLLYSMIILYATVAPFLLQNILHVSIINFGHLTMLVGLGWFIGSLINRFTLHVTQHRKIKTCLSIMLIAILVMIIVNKFIIFNTLAFMAPIFVIMICGGIVFPNYFSRAVILFPDKTGSANALMGTFVFVIPSLVSMLGTFLKTTSPLPLALVYGGLVTVCLLLADKKEIESKKRKH
jgi:Bcr/CflA subfamily drug resistance transporter